MRERRAWTRSIIKLSFVVALAFVLSAVEEFFLPFIPLPGVKLGLANLPLLLFLPVLSAAELVLAQLLRILLVAFFFRGLNPLNLTLSLAGGGAALIVLLFLRANRLFSLAGMGALMAAAHLLAQFAVAVWMLQAKALLIYLPPAGIAASLLGFLGGILANQLKERLETLI